MTVHYALDEMSWDVLKKLVNVVALVDNTLAVQIEDVMEVAKEVDL